MATFTAFEGTNSAVLSEIYALTNGAAFLPTPTETTFVWTDPAKDTIILTLTGTGMNQAQSSWLITDITATINNHEVWDISIPSASALHGDALQTAVVNFTPGHFIFSGDDTLYGATTGSSELFGFDGNDTIIARGGNTKLDGGGGFDTLIGAKTGHDVFEFNSRLDPTVNLDMIVGFSPTRDKIELSQEVFHNINHFGVLTAGEFHVGRHATTTAQRILYTPSNGHLYYDADGSGHHNSPVLFAVLTNHPTLTAADFLVV
jgi:Ca2+-binding RTX toxin-like protein